MAFIASSARVQYRQQLDDPTVDRRMIDQDAILIGHFFEVPQASGKRPSEAVLDANRD